MQIMTYYQSKIYMRKTEAVGCCWQKVGSLSRYDILGEGA